MSRRKLAPRGTRDDELLNLGGLRHKDLGEQREQELGPSRLIPKVRNEFGWSVWAGNVSKPFPKQYIKGTSVGIRCEVLNALPVGYYSVLLHR